MGARFLPIPVAHIARDPLDLFDLEWSGGRHSGAADQAQTG